mmetsp:Transcript_9309/g.14925  ORF Transcript_9309/g.14925 Transcript_9309/m.14925 type:complete len:230 (-) Transcript_9309:1959-2648(-)|eukprot:CAMPEP_0178734304 /NCGR_PEP_ID=MMETSP0744-20121128/1272_1 /TAXON_ID=913974 /ORGANISM="Nitzschia punctata, Strain CCMP561" /LENGTH=229 /DNA_ID=CAMNT_0020386575 /DNA_START=134 /DNA_END=823 /DNA_ORIENTATION=-
MTSTIISSHDISSDSFVWQDAMFANSDDVVIQDDDLFSESSHSEAAQVYQSWQSEDEDMMSNTGIVSEEEDDVIMQLEEDEGLLPSTLEDDFYDDVDRDIISSTDDTISLMLLTSAQDTPALVAPTTLISTKSNVINSIKGNDSFLSVPSVQDERTRFQSTVFKLAESMRRSQETRRSLYARTPGLSDYKRLGSVERVLQSVEFSTHQVDSYCKALAAAAATSSSPSLQ